MSDYVTLGPHLTFDEQVAAGHAAYDVALDL